MKDGKKRDAGIQLETVEEILRALAFASMDTFQVIGKRAANEMESLGACLYSLSVISVIVKKRFVTLTRSINSSHKSSILNMGM